MTEKTKGTLECQIGPKGIAIGIEIKDNKIIKVFPSSAFLGQLFSNDLIKAVNGKPTPNTAAFCKIITDNAPGNVTIEYERDETLQVIAKPVPGGRPGFELIEIEIVWITGDSALGLLITKNAENKVVIAMIEDGSILSKQVQAGDILEKVNDVDVSGKEMARTLIHDSMNNNKKVKLTLERPKKENGAVISTPSSNASSTTTTIVTLAAPPSTSALPPIQTPSTTGPSTATENTPSASVLPTVQIATKSQMMSAIQTDKVLLKSEQAAEKSAQGQAQPPPQPQPQVQTPTTASTSTATPTVTLSPALTPSKSVEVDSTYTPATIGIVSKYQPPPVIAPPVGWKKSASADPNLPADVLEIMAANKLFFTVLCGEPSMLRMQSNPSAPHVVEASLTEMAPEVETAFDPSSKPLKKTPKRLGA